MYKIPSREEIGILPIRSQLAFAARCARRVQAFVQSQNDELGRICQFAEGFAANNEPSLSAQELEVRHLTNRSTSHVSASLNMVVSDLVEIVSNAKAAGSEGYDDPGYAEADRMVTICCLESDRYGLLDRAVAERDYYRKRIHLRRQASGHRIAEKATEIAETLIAAAIDAGCDESLVSKEIRCDYEVLLAAVRAGKSKT